MKSYYTVIGNPISHSLSPQLMNAGFQELGLDAYFTRVLLEEVGDFKLINNYLDFKACSVTAPFKRDFLQLSKVADQTAEETGVTNALVKINGDSWRAFNTDIPGAMNPLISRIGPLQGKHVLVIGAGGAAKAVMNGLADQKAIISIYNRTAEKAKKLADLYGGQIIQPDALDALDLHKFSAIINTTPVLPTGFENYEALPDQVVFDASYKHKPFSMFFKKSDPRYIDGKEWLIAQGQISIELFTGHTISTQVFEKALLNPVQKKVDNIFLIGPMGAGKTTVGQNLASLSGWKWVDLDAEIEKDSGISIASIFESKGEAWFRETEKEMLQAASKMDNLIISCGGGIVNLKENRDILNQNHTVFLFVSPETSVKRNRLNNRPLLAGKDALSKAESILQDRLDHYVRSSHTIVNGESGDSSAIAQLIWADYKSSYQ